jgi:hypothetical protein
VAVSNNWEYIFPVAFHVEPIAREVAMHKLLGSVLFFATAAVAGCASVGTASAVGECAKTDCALVSAVDNIAARSGVKVIWLNLPAAPSAAVTTRAD